MAQKSPSYGVFTEMATRAAVTGAVGLVGSMVLGDQFSRPVSIGPVQLPAPVAVGATVAASSVAADLTREYVLPRVPGNKRLATIEGTAMGLGVAGLSTAFILGSAGSQQSFLYRGAIGAGSYAAGDYIHSKVFNNQTHLTLF
jgi:hypothetical protein